MARRNSNVIRSDDVTGQSAAADAAPARGDLANKDEPALKRRRQSQDKISLLQSSSEELKQYKDAEYVSHSGIFRLQTQELMNEVKVKDSYRQMLRNFADQIIEKLQSVPFGKQRPVSKRKWLAKLPVCIPFAFDPPSPPQYTFSFHPPSVTHDVGSFHTGTSVKPLASLDVAVEMPAACLSRRDYLNYLYLRKRVLYLCVLAHHVRSIESVDEVFFQRRQGDPLLPILVIVPKGKFGRYCAVHIHVVPPADHFKLTRFLPTTSNVRRSWFQGIPEDKSVEKAGMVSSLCYNQSMLSDVLAVRTSRKVQALIGDAEGLRDGLILLHIWLRQRQLSEGYGGFSRWIMSAYVAYLVEQRRLNQTMSNYQVFRSTLLALASSTWDTTGISFKQDDLSDTNRLPLSDYFQWFKLVFMDSSGYLNFASRLDLTAYNRVKFEAKLSLELLKQHSGDIFEALFMKPCHFIHRFDQIFHINGLSMYKDHMKLANLDGSNEQKFADDNDGVVYFHRVLLPSLTTILRKGLGDRIELLDISLPSTSKWHVIEQPPEPAESITVGVLLNSNTFGGVVDRGPAANTPEGAEFRAFWGDRSELRKFSDGLVCEAVVWSARNESERRQITGAIVKHVLHRHCRLAYNDIVCHTSPLDAVLTLPRSIMISSGGTGGVCPSGTGEEAFSKLRITCDRLGQILRNLEDMPLQVLSIHPIDPALRKTEPFPPLPWNYSSNKSVVYTKGRNLVPRPSSLFCPRYIAPMEVQLTLESSGQWPSDVEAVRRLKAACHIKIAELLQTQCNLLTSPSKDWVDVLIDDFVFRIRLVYPREITLLKQRLDESGILIEKQTEESARLELETVHRPQLASALDGVSQQHIAFSGCCRLAKRWICAHMLSDYIEIEAIELIIASIFLSSASSGRAPRSYHTAFISFLQLLASHDWLATPLIVNFNHELSDEQMSALTSKFVSLRPTLPIMTIITPFDHMGSRWTRPEPSSTIMDRLITLADASYQTLQDGILDSTGGFEPMMLFRTPLGAYDVLIHLNDLQNPKHYMQLDFTQSAASSHQHHRDQSDNHGNKYFPVVDYDPIRSYLAELRATFDDFALFFHDALGGSVIGVVWKPHTFLPVEMKTANVNGRVWARDAGSDGLMFNIDGAVETFKVLGQGLVSSVDIRRSM